MAFLRIRNWHKRKYALICLGIVGFIIYRYLMLPAGGRIMSRKLGLSANSSQLTLEGEPFRIIGGSIHYFRVPRAYWRDRLIKMKACGLNTLTTAYINLAAELGLWVILRPGPYISSELDLGGLPSWLLRDGSMKLRTSYPGFTDAVENEYGSYAKDESYMLFIKEVILFKSPLESLSKSLLKSSLKSLRKSLLESPLKSPLKFPLESPFKSPLEFPLKFPLEFPLKSLLKSPLKTPLESLSKSLLKSLLKSTLESPFKSPLEFPLEFPLKSLLKSPLKSPLESLSKSLLSPSRVPIQVTSRVPSRVPSQVSSQVPSRVPFQVPSRVPVQPNSPMMVMDYWTGGYDVWGDLHHVLPLEDMVSTVREILRQGMSVNLYMFHGGSSFGFMSGALADPSYKALVPSYDYDAPLSEAGEYTPKYHLLRDLLSRYNRGDSLPDMTALHYREAYEPAIMYQHLSLWDALSLTEGPFKSPKPVSMENLPVNNGNGQSYGYTLYETTITSGGLLKSGDNVRDRALGRRTLSLLVENCGRVHQGRDLDKQHKGDLQTICSSLPCLLLNHSNTQQVLYKLILIYVLAGLVGDILLNNIPLRDFTIYSLDMKPGFIDSLYQAPWKTLPETPSFPGFFMGRLFAYGYPSDTFVKLPAWEKGAVFINGINLGRYWSIGPQQALYLPGPFINSGINQVIVFEEQEGDFKVLFDDTPDLGMAAEIQ
ncbi:hypothetical protein F7725_007310 [Dissostichus mawsoni]|uniref:Beta-galactosidase n=1 Tax=Dissostichus mawsoni TaxID=36200 RepID=A0A7J5XZB1_DISMA|nr:hypothetical protein F7725_007310 [Dissostichus mawsoni]